MKFRVERQITVAIENQPGRLAAVSRALAGRGVNIKDISILDNVEQGVIRLVASDAGRCKEMLHELGFHPVEAEVLIIDLADTPGRLAVVSDALAKGGVNIDYAYGSEDSTEQKMRVVMKVSPLPRACHVLESLQES